MFDCKKWKNNMKNIEQNGKKLLIFLFHSQNTEKHKDYTSPFHQFMKQQL